jgi:tripartite-type tricarboxylate transporter receptor subunit TctC
MVIPAINRQIIELHRSGKLRILAVAAPDRLTGAPEIPTAVETGLPGLITQNIISLVAPTGTPGPIVDRIRAASQTVVADEKLQEQFLASGFEPPRDRSPEAVRKWVEEEIVRWTPIVRAIGLKVD